jgi:hypothetical protein
MGPISIQVSLATLQDQVLFLFSLSNLNKLLFRLKIFGALKCSIVLYEHFKNKKPKERWTTRPFRKG